MPPCWPCLVCERVIVDGKAGLARSEVASCLAAVAGIPLLHRASIQLALAAVRQAIGVANPGALSVLVSVNLTLSAVSHGVRPRWFSHAWFSHASTHCDASCLHLSLLLQYRRQFPRQVLCCRKSPCRRCTSEVCLALAPSVRCLCPGGRAVTWRWR